MLKSVQACNYDTKSSALLAMVVDARRFVLEYRSIMEVAPLQTYCSALIFAPVKSIVRNAYQKEMPSAIWIISSMVPDWSPCLQTLKGHGGPVTAVAFSPDGSKLASTSNDRMVRLWDAVDKAEEYPDYVALELSAIHSSRSRRSPEH